MTGPDKLRAVLEADQCVLADVAEYLERFADAEQDEAAYHPNDAMRLLVAVRRRLGETDDYPNAAPSVPDAMLMLKGAKP